jgi:NADPH:quinone reductase-like Zn-dependent oxidoreductase
VDFVIEVAGRGTIGRSIRSTKPGGLVAVSGEFYHIGQSAMADTEGYVSTFKPIDDAILKEDLAQTILYSAANVRGVFACNREDLKTMVSALEAGGVKPVIDKVRVYYRKDSLILMQQTFPFSELKDAYQYMIDGKHFGKVCVSL